MENICEISTAQGKVIGRSKNQRNKLALQQWWIELIFEKLTQPHPTIWTNYQNNSDRIRYATRSPKVAQLSWGTGIANKNKSTLQWVVVAQYAVDSNKHILTQGKMSIFRPANRGMIDCFLKKRPRQDFVPLVAFARTCRKPNPSCATV